MLKSPYALRAEKLGATVVKALLSRKFEAYYEPTNTAAAALALSLIPEGHTVGWGGSASLTQSGLLDLVKSHRTVIDRDTAKTHAEKHILQKQILTCDTFITGTNALAENGILVNVDGNGNRIAPMSYGPDNVIVLVGINKIVKSVDDAVSRARNIAAPLNAQRFNLTTPCITTGTCTDCKTEGCICSYIVVTRFCKPAGRIKVIISGEDLGY